MTNDKSLNTVRHSLMAYKTPESLFPTFVATPLKFRKRLKYLLRKISDAFFEAARQYINARTRKLDYSLKRYTYTVHTTRYTTNRIHKVVPFSILI